MEIDYCGPTQAVTGLDGLTTGETTSREKNSRMVNQPGAIGGNLSFA
jgi:hypothetical protein